MTEPLIFTVHLFRPVENNCVRMDVHYVVGFSSADAERRIKEEQGQHLDYGTRFIITDELMAAHPRSCQFYTTRYRNEDAMPASEFSNWIRRMTEPHFSDGEREPAAFRQF